MSLVGNPIPPRPAYFGPDGAPPGIAVDLDAYDPNWVASRPRISPRVGVVHTNGGPGEGTIGGALAVANSGSNTTHPHYNLNAPIPTKHLRTDLRSIANSTPRHIEEQYGEIDCSFWTISYETADRGYDNGGSTDLGDFLYDHDELLARAIAYDSIVHNIPIIVPVVWNAAGFVTHTAPFDGVYTIHKGKSCPGTTKKNRVLHGDILPRAREIRAAWTDATPEPEPPTEDDMTPYLYQPPAERTGCPTFYVEGGSMRVATGRDLAEPIERFRDNHADRVVRYDLAHEAVVHRTP
jgi:hypothetical protein